MRIGDWIGLFRHKYVNGTEICNQIVFVARCLQWNNCCLIIAFKILLNYIQLARHNACRATGLFWEINWNLVQRLEMRTIQNAAVLCVKHHFKQLITSPLVEANRTWICIILYQSYEWSDINVWQRIVFAQSKHRRWRKHALLRNQCDLRRTWQRPWT